MKTTQRLWLTAISALLGWFIYLQWYWDYVSNLTWFPFLMVTCTFSVILMFLHVVEYGEAGHLLVFGSDAKVECEPGWYLLPSLFPALRGIGICFGVDMALERVRNLGSVAGSPNFYHYRNQNLPNYNVGVETTSFLAANLNQDYNRLKNSIFSFHDKEGRVAYYKLGTILYVACWVMAFVGNLGHHATQATQAATTAISSGVNSLGNALGVPPPRNGPVMMYTPLSVGEEPTIPSRESFTPKVSSTARYDFLSGDARKYFYYTEEPDGVFLIAVREASCFRVPVGRKIIFSTPYPPTQARNMHRFVAYIRKRTPGNILEGLYVLTRHHELRDYYSEETSWPYAHDHWGDIRKNQTEVILETQALTLEQLQKVNADTRGGLVCF